MDETQKRKVSAKEFIEKNKRLGYGVVGIFVSLFIIYFAFVYFYTGTESESSNNQNQSAQTGTSEESFFGSLLPTFNFTEQTDPELENDFLNNFSNPNNIRVEGQDIADDSSKIIKIEPRPVLGYTVFDKSVSIKNYIKNKPKICAAKIEPILTKEEKSTGVLNFQNTLRNITDYEDTPDTGILDEKTREKLFIFQTRYAEILYKNKSSKTPTRLVDKETAHFLNLLCNFDIENKDDYVQVPTLRYIVKESREIFDYNTDSKEKTAVGAKVATGTEDMTISKNGDYAVFRKEINGTIDSVFYNIRTKSVTHLENNITTLDFNDKNILIYGVPGSSGITIKSYNNVGNMVKKIATLPLNEWEIKSTLSDEIAIYSKPSAFADGIYMTLNTSTQKLRQLAGPLLGLSAQKTNVADFSILSVGGQGTTKTLLLNHKTRNVGDFGIRTFAEKCSQTIFADGVFCAVPKNLPEGLIYPDDWYKGKFYPEDILVYKSLSGTSTKTISYLENRPLSIVNLNVNKNGIFFIDENTFSLYSLEI
jgi:hypothetical protein